VVGNMYLLKKAIKIIKRDGGFKFFRKCIIYIFDQAMTYNPISLFLRNSKFNYRAHQRRIKLSQVIFDNLEGVVKYGPLKGFKINKNSKWGEADRGGMLLGLYEKEIQEMLLAASKNRRILVDLGAADGFFGVGAVASNLFDRSYCYEVSDEARNALFETAEANNVSNRISVRGIAEPDFYNDLLVDAVALTDVVILSDIEGAEFSVFTAETLANLSKAKIIIEIHDWGIGRDAQYDQLKKSAEKYFKISEIRTGARDLSHIEELENFHDSDRWILCSEGRGNLGKWICLDPKNQNNMHTESPDYRPSVASDLG